MIAVIFEVYTAEGQTDTYLEHAARMRPMVEEHPGFISVERFRSLTDPNKLLSVSFFEDEDALNAWRNRPEHRATQSAGRDGIFDDYRLRVAEVIRDYGMHNREQAPLDSKDRHG